MAFGFPIVDAVLNFIEMALKFIVTIPDKFLPTGLSSLIITGSAFVLGFFLGRYKGIRWILGIVLFLLFIFLRG